ncbi:MAG: hypothetical protein RIC89_00180 [Pseudomonadales bacterium]
MYQPRSISVGERDYARLFTLSFKHHTQAVVFTADASNWTEP